MHPFHCLAALAAVLNVVQARDAFAHYMVGTVTDAHAQQDIEDAIAMGLDGFVLNVGYPQATYVYPTLLSLFQHAENQNSLGHPFKLLISMDLGASGAYKRPDGSSVNAFDYVDLLRRFLPRSGYYTVNGIPMITTFSDGGMSSKDFDDWRETLGSIYFVPDLDGTAGFSASSEGWWDYWGSTVDGVSSWESAWPVAGSGVLGSVDIDNQVITGGSTGTGTAARGKSYMIPLSALQYKDAYGANVYRAGGLNLVERMKNINNMTIMADWVQIITWNDGPESHYIGNIWPESNSDSAPARYVSSTKSPHTGWQGIISSFIATFKNGNSTVDQWRTQGANPSESNHVGAIWYHSIRTSVTCPDSPPAGLEIATDKLAYAIVSNSGSDLLTLRYGNQSASIVPGLNSGEFDLASGSQRVELWDGSVLVMVANGERCTYDTCVDGIYNLNPEVASFKTNWGADSTC